MQNMYLRILDKDEHKQLVEKLKVQCVSEENIGFAILSDATTLPCIRIDKRLFKKLVQAGSINVISRITTLSLPPDLYVKLEIYWPTIKVERNLILNGWRDRNFLEHLCDTKKLALTVSGSSVIVVDGINTEEQLEARLVITSMMYHPKGATYYEPKT